MCVLLITRLLRGVGRLARKPVNHTSWVAVVTPTDRPKSVRNRCLIKLFCGVVCVVTLPFWHFCWCRGFCHLGLSQISSFLSLNKYPRTTLKYWFCLHFFLFGILSTAGLGLSKPQIQSSFLGIPINQMQGAFGVFPMVQMWNYHWYRWLPMVPMVATKLRTVYWHTNGMIGKLLTF